MARFILELKLKGRPNRNRPTETIARRRLILGSRPLADIYVNDRMVAQEALSLDFDGHRLTLDVLSELAGVFIDGRPVEGQGPVPDGCALQVGHCLVEVTIDRAAGTCTLTTHEGHLPVFVDTIVKRAKPDPPFALVGSGAQEEKWGKNPFLRKANRVAAALGVLVLVAFPFVHDSEAMTRGELAAVHQASHSADAPQDCAACHAPFSSDYGVKCGVCHEDLYAADAAAYAFHPFEAVGDVACSACHLDHRGGDASIIPEAAFVMDEDTGRPRMCSQCHDRALEPGTRGKSVRDRAGDPVRRWLQVDGFSHRDHRVAEGRAAVAAVPLAPEAGQVPIECEKCHVPDTVAGAAPSPIASAEYALVTYETCLECHADWSVPVHGRDDDGVACYACHAKAATPSAITADLAHVTLPPAGSLWNVAPRAHDVNGDDCLSCHVQRKERRGAPREPLEMVFRHDHHLRGTTVAAGTGLTFSEQCLPCHQTLSASDTLDGTPLVDTSGCIGCHTDGEPVPVTMAAAPSRTVSDMFHRVHTVDPSTLARGALKTFAQRATLSSGCVACHVPVAGEERMGLREGTTDCRACHERHANIGQGRCVLCHVDRRFEGNRRADGRLDFVYQEQGIYDPAKAVTKTTTPIPEFDHMSDGHSGHECAACHPVDVVDGAERVLDLPWPAVDDASCVQCHAVERYHR